MAVFASVRSFSLLFKAERVGVYEGDANILPKLVFFDRGFRVVRLMMGWERKWGRSGNSNPHNRRDGGLGIGGGGRFGHGFYRNESLWGRK